MKPLDIEEFKRTGRAMGTIAPDAYHALKKTLPNCVSKSILTEFAANPFRWKYNQDHKISKTSTGFRWGSLVDTLALTPWEFERKYKIEAERPQLTKKGEPYADGRQDPEQRKEWEKLKTEKGITVISPEEADRGKECADKITEVLSRYGYKIGETADTQVGFLFRLYFEVENKDGQLVRCPVTCTGMIDLLPRDCSEPIIDLKTTSALVDNARQIDNALRTFKYGWQAAMYSDMLAGITGEQRDFSLFFVENAAPWCMTWRHLKQDTLKVYRKQYHEALYDYARAVVTGEYPGQIVDAPDYIPTPWEEFPD